MIPSITSRKTSGSSRNTNRLATKAPDVFTANDGGNTQAVAKVLFTQYFFPFEVTSILLLVAAIAAMVLAHRKAHAVTQAEIDAAAVEDATPAYDAETVP